VKKWITLINIFTLMIPYYIISNLFYLCCRKNKNIWMSSPLRLLISPVMLPNGYQIFWSWSQDPFWFKDIIQEVYHHETYEHFFSMKENDIVVDVGANVGLFSLKASKVVGEHGIIVAFEPEKNNYKMLRRNLGINKCRNVIPINAAVSNFNGKADFSIANTLVEHKLADSKSELEIKSILTTKVDVKTIQLVLKELGIDRVDFLKIDAEGSEFEVLSGARSLLTNKAIKKMSVAVYHSKDEPKLVGDYLRQFGYNVLYFRSVGLCNFPKIHAYGFTDLPENR